MPQHGMTAMIRSMAWDLGLPVAAYYGLHALGAGDRTALLAGTAAAGVRVAWVAARSRTLSPFSAVMAAMFGVGLLFTLLTGDPRDMLIKHSAMSLAVGATFLITGLRGTRPLTLAAQQTFQPTRAKDLVTEYATNPLVRRGHLIASLVWGCGLIAEALLRAVLVYALPIDVMVGLSTALTVLTFAALLTWNARFITTSTRRAEALAGRTRPATDVVLPPRKAPPMSASAAVVAATS